MDNDKIEQIIFKIVKQVRDSIIDIEGIKNLEYRRDYDGLSSLDYLIEKAVGNILSGDSINNTLAGLEKAYKVREVK